MTPEKDLHCVRMVEMVILAMYLLELLRIQNRVCYVVELRQIIARSWVRRSA